MLKMTNRWEIRFKRICLFGWLALAGLPFIALAMCTADFIRDFAVVAALLLIVPAFV
jgi:hypothetical protein